MLRRASLLLVSASVVGLGLVTWREESAPHSARLSVPAPIQAESAEAPSAPAATTPGPAPSGQAADAEAAQALPDASPVPALGSGAPAKVRLGIALFSYRTAQGAVSPRSKAEAQKLAKAANEAASEGFRRAIAKGDAGSHEDIGWIARGILEPNLEAAVFALPVGGQSAEPLDTPRGYWVVRRIK
jgi:parvulin-like peptidyl-prolyl isomerase